MNKFILNKDQVIETPELLDLLDSINREINKFPYRTDKVKHGQLDYWTSLIDKYAAGDCDDYALTKRRKLIEADVPFECMFPTICMAGNEGHLVLVVRTDKRDLMLDNIEKKVVSVSSVNYKWLYRLDARSSKWVKLS